jgi:hypothetical protein
MDHRGRDQIDDHCERPQAGEDAKQNRQRARCRQQDARRVKEFRTPFEDKRRGGYRVLSRRGVLAATPDARQEEHAQSHAEYQRTDIF